MNADAIIFDMDGTLWDSSDVVAESWNNVINACPDVKEPISADRIKSVMGKHLFVIAEELFPQLEQEKRLGLIKSCCEQENILLTEKGGKLFEGLEDTLRDLKQKSNLYIVSNCQSGYIEAFFAHHKLDRYFSDYQCAGASSKTKGENLIDLIERNNIKSAYYVGDTQIDYDATRKACIPFVYAAYGFGQVQGYEYRIDAITDLADMFN